MDEPNMQITAAEETQKLIDSLPPWGQEIMRKAREVPSDPVKRPAHYTKGEIEVIDFIEQIVANYPPELAHHIGCIIKYVSRAPLKGNLSEDLSKAEWYLRRAINKSITLKTPVKRD